MQKLPAFLIATVLSALLPIAVYAEDQGNSVKTSHSPYKPGRQIESDASTSADAAPSTNAPEGDGKPVKHAQSPFKLIRQVEVRAATADVGPAPAPYDTDDQGKSSRPRYKPGRQVDDKQ